MTQSMKRIHKVVVKRMYDSDPDTSWMGEYSDRPESEYAIDRAHDEDCASQSYNSNPQAENTLKHVQGYLAEQLEAEQYTPWEKQGHEAGCISRQGLDAPCSCRVQDWQDGIEDAQQVVEDAIESLNECDCGRSGEWNRREYRYFNGPVDNYKGESDEDIRKYVRQDYERMERLQRGDWGFIGIRAEAEYYVATKARAATGEHVTFLMQTVSSGGLWGIESDSDKSDKSYFAEVEKEELAELRKQLEGIGFSKRAVSAAFKTIEHENE